MADEKKPSDDRAPLMRDAAVSIVRRLPPKARDEETEEEKTAREAAAEDVIEIAISSELPVRRGEWLGWDTYREFDEILLHGEGDVDLGYARDGLPFFVNHSSWDMVGLVEDVRLDPDRVLRGRVRFSKSQRGQEIERDIRDGIRKKVSVGYDYSKDNYSETTDNGRTVRKVRLWRPMETSSVPIPADYDVGVGRSARPGARRPDEPPGTPAAKAKEHNVDNATPAATAEAARAEVAREYGEIADLARIHKLEARLPEWIAKKATKDQVREDILEHHRKKSEELLTRGGTGRDVLDLTDRDAKQFSFARAISSQMNGERGYEQEVSDELYKKLGRKRSNPHAMMVPTQLLGRHQRAMAVATSGSGQQLKFAEYGGFFEILRPRMKLTKLGARTLSGLVGDVAFVTQPSANTFQWGAETAAPTATNFGTGLKTLAPKNGAALTAFTRQLLQQSVESVEGLVQDDLLKIIALAIDLAGIAGSGSTQPTGIISTSGIGSVTMGTNGAVPTFPKIVDMETEVAVDNADVDTMSYLSTPGIRGYLKKTEQFSGTNGMPIWTGGAQGTLNGYNAEVSTQVPSTLTKGTSTGTCHAILFGDFSNVIIGEWGAIELIVDPYSAKPTIIEVAAHVMVDVLLRYPEGLCAMLDAKTS
jgi:HK97 family phage major capsid protein